MVSCLHRGPDGVSPANRDRRGPAVRQRPAGAGGPGRQEPAGGVPDHAARASTSGSRASAGRWTATAGERGVAQAAYQIEVRDPKGAVVWDSKKIDERRVASTSRTPGAPLAAGHEVRVDGDGLDPGGRDADRQRPGSRPGYGSRRPASPAWGGATWIGGGDDDLVLYAPYLAIFDVKYAVTIAPGSTRASFVYGANDSRLMDRNKNIYQVESAKDQSYIKLELDISALGGTPDGKAKLHVYRAGYKDTDNAAQPLQDVRDRRRRSSTTRTSTPSTPSSSAARSARSRSHRRQHDASPASARRRPAAPAARRRRRAGRPTRRAERRQPEPDGIGRRLPPVRHAVRHRLLGRTRARRATFRDVDGPQQPRAAATSCSARTWPARAYTGIYADAVTPASGLSVANGAVRAGGRRAAASSSCATRAATRCRCCGRRSRRRRKADRRARASTSRRAASTRCS